MEIAVLLPCYNEEPTIAEVVRSYRELLPDAKIYVYDNNSSDKTATVAREAGAIVRTELRQGKGFVVRSMFRDIDADVYLMADGDNTYDPSDVVALAQDVLDGKADMVIGDRLSGTYFEENTRALHGAGNRLIRWLINKIFKSDIRDVMTGGRAFSKLYAKTYPGFSGRWELEPELTVHALSRDFRVTQGDVKYQERPDGSVSKANTVRDGILVLKTIAALFKDCRPLLFFGSAAAILMALAIGFFIPPFEQYIATGIVTKLPTLVVSIGLGIGSLLSIVCGVILDSIRKQTRAFYELFVNKTARELELTE